MLEINLLICLNVIYICFIFEANSDNVILNENKSDNDEEGEEENNNPNDLIKIRTENLLKKAEKLKIEKTLNNLMSSKKDVSSPYDEFIEDGGIVSETISDRGSTFQAHIIRISSAANVSQLTQKLKTNNKIAKATHNILAYRVKEHKKDITQGFDDDGEAGAGIRLLAVLEKMKIVNIYVCVSRWFGGTMLGNDRFKHINDVAKNLIVKHKDLFDYSD